MNSKLVARLRRYARLASLNPKPDDSFMLWAWHSARSDDDYFYNYALMSREIAARKLPPVIQPK